MFKAFDCEKVFILFQQLTYIQNTCIGMFNTFQYNCMYNLTHNTSSTGHYWKKNTEVVVYLSLVIIFVFFINMQTEEIGW